VNILEAEALERVWLIEFSLALEGFLLSKGTDSPLAAGDFCQRKKGPGGWRPYLSCGPEALYTLCTSFKEVDIHIFGICFRG
jgi:hypothetical protein